MLDLYMSEGYSHHWSEIVRLAKLDDKESRLKLRKYAMEGCRLAPQAYGLFRNVAQDICIKEGGKTYDLRSGDKVFVNLVRPFLDSLT
jgi:hypothetical protein